MSDYQPFSAPKLRVENQVVDGEDVVTVLVGDVHPYEAPLAPAGLYDVETERVEAFPLHKLVKRVGNTWTFRTYGKCLPLLPIVSRDYVYRPWWTERAWELVTDTDRVWTRATYPDNGSHLHCEITFAQIGGGQEPEAYVSDGSWVTREAYERFIRDDEFHCRR